MSETIKLDIDDLTLGDLDDFEDHVGLPLQECVQPGKAPSAKALLALVWITQRKTDPDYTLEQARAVKVGELDFEVDPTDAAG